MSGSGGRRFDVTGLQVLASVLATISGAVAASYLGVAGTIIGAAVMSVASTAGSSVYRHYLDRTAGRLKDAATVVAAQRARAEWTAAGTRATARQARGDSASPDQTQPDLTHLDQTQPDQTKVGGAETPTEPTEPGDGGGRSRRWGDWLRGRPAWLAVAMASLGIFAGVIGGITVFEAAAGKPLQAVVWQHKGTGTTVGGLVGGGSSQPTKAASHQPRPSHSASPAPTPSRTPTGSPSPTPTPSSGSPSPTGSPTPTPTGSSPSASPSASRTTGTH